MEEIENRLRFDKINATNLSPHFFGPLSRVKRVFSVVTKYLLRSTCVLNLEIYNYIYSRDKKRPKF